MRGPGICRGRTLDALTNHIDLTPTFLDLAGVSVDKLSFDGQTLTPLLSGQGDWQRDANFGEYHPTVKSALYNQTIRTQKWRLSIYPSSPQWGEMFGLESDPDEHVNLFYDDSVKLPRRELEQKLVQEFPPQLGVDNPLLCKW